MRDLEKSLLKDKPWQDYGEIAAGGRSKYSLGDKNPEFDFGRKKNYGVTEEYNEELEKYALDVFLKRDFYDRKREEKPSNINIPRADTSKATIELDHSKSKESLAEVNEDQYLQNTLSNRWDLKMAKGERTDTGKRREWWRKKSIHTLESFREEEKLNSNAYTKDLANSTARRKAKHRKNTTIGKSKEVKIKSSKGFHSRLQNTVSVEMASGNPSSNKKRKIM